MSARFWGACGVEECADCLPAFDADNQPIPAGPKVTNVRRHAGIAGSHAISASVQYEGEQASTITFVGYGFESRTIVMCAPGNPGGTFVASSVVDRLGTKLDEAWVRAFFAPKAGEL
jgi:hypothetical protein